MKQELQEELFNIAPEFFNRTNMRASAMCFGFDVGDGWYPLVRILVQAAKWHKDNPRYVPRDDGSHLFRAPLDCVPEDRENWEIQPNRVERNATDEECPYRQDTYGLRPFLCVGGKKHEKIDVSTHKPGHRAEFIPGMEIEGAPPCEGCEGTGKFVYYRHLCERPWNHFQVVQVKEKFGGLRFYVEGGSEEYNGMIRFAESMSYRTCEFCGMPGSMDRSEWYMLTLCLGHKAARQKAKKEGHVSIDSWVDAPGVWSDADYMKFETEEV